MKFLVATVLLATCLVAQAKVIPNSAAISLSDFYKHNTNEAGRIISGDPAELGQFPYQAALHVTTSDGKSGICGGTLISSKWILTAAHCAKDGVSWDIKLGGIRIDMYEPSQVALTSYKAFVHPNYGQHFNNDIALIELPSEVSFTNYIQPLRLSKKSEAGYPLENILVRVSGWGKIHDSDAGASNFLSFVYLNTISNAECAAFWGSAGVLDSNICCRGHPDHSPCNGDSGGPLVRMADDGQLTHTGIVSYGMMDGCAKGYPSVFIRSASYLDWIHEITGIPIMP